MPLHPVEYRLEGPGGDKIVTKLVATRKSGFEKYPASGPGHRSLGEIQDEREQS